MKSEIISIETVKKISELEEENKKLQEKINKAIEYIKWDMDKNEEYIEYCNFKDNYEKLLNILEGSDNNE